MDNKNIDEENDRMNTKNCANGDRTNIETISNTNKMNTKIVANAVKNNRINTDENKSVANENKSEENNSGINRGPNNRTVRFADSEMNNQLDQILEDTEKKLQLDNKQEVERKGEEAKKYLLETLIDMNQGMDEKKMRFIKSVAL